MPSVNDTDDILICKHFKGFPFRCAGISCTGHLYDSYLLYQNDFIFYHYLKNAETPTQRNEARKEILRLESHSYKDQSPNGSFIWDQ